MQVIVSIGVVAVDLSLSMPMLDVFVIARRVGSAIVKQIEEAPRHTLAGVIGFSSRARELHADELASVDWDFQYGLDLDAALELATTLLRGEAGRIAVISALEFHELRSDGSYTADVSATSQAAGQARLAHWLGTGLVVDLLWCRGARPGSGHEAVCLDLVRHQGGFAQRLDPPDRGLNRYLDAVWS